MKKAISQKQLKEIHDYFSWSMNNVYYNSNIPTDVALGMEKAYKDSMLKICPLINCEYYKQKNITIIEAKNE